jgi:hypothetical protein
MASVIEPTEPIITGIAEPTGLARPKGGVKYRVEEILD